MLLPTGAESFTEAMKIGTETYHTLKKVINAKYGIDGERVGPSFTDSTSYDIINEQRPTSVMKAVLRRTSLLLRNL